MKKVRFETQSNFTALKMNDSECHSPRPFTEKKIDTKTPDIYFDYPKILHVQSDPIQMYESSNSSPYPVASRTSLQSSDESQSKWMPSRDLELSMLDGPYSVPEKPIHSKSDAVLQSEMLTTFSRQVLSSVENKMTNIFNQDDSFFITRENLSKSNLQDINSISKKFNRLNIGKENGPLARKAEIMNSVSVSNPISYQTSSKCIDTVNLPNSFINDTRKCHHCFKQTTKITVPPNSSQCCNTAHGCCPCLKPLPHRNYCHDHHECFYLEQNLTTDIHHDETKKEPLTAVDKKTWAIEKFEKSKHSPCSDIEVQNNVKQNYVKEKREPTVTDLFKIIKLQNEQLQLLQEKVDKFISVSKPIIQNVTLPCVENYMTEQAALETIDKKVSIGVMTSFEMVRTSTIINKEIVTQMNDNQVQCNRSEISIKEVVTKSQPRNPNFLDGIRPMSKTAQAGLQVHMGESLHNESNLGPENAQFHQSDVDDKTMNDMSLYNVQVDNATTPYMSPEPSLCLDVRDYSDSDSSGEDQSNVGWTYYNKVMNHVNGMLQDTDMPSSASALHRKTRQCVQMQIDKTNVSVAKRVKFGDDPLGVLQPHLYTASDTSLKMNQLAAKYLKNGVRPALVQSAPKPSMLPSDLSFATRNYMERHKLLQGSTANQIPRFLDITALKQQPKFL